MSRVRFFLFVAMCSLFAIPAFAQFNASIQGTIADPSGAVIPGATVTGNNQATGVVITVTSSGAGLYRIDHLAPGDLHSFGHRSFVPTECQQ